MEDLSGAASLNRSSKRKAESAEDQGTANTPLADISVPWESNATKVWIQDECGPYKRPKREPSEQPRLRRPSHTTRPRRCSPIRPTAKARPTSYNTPPSPETPTHDINDSEPATSPLTPTAPTTTIPPLAPPQPSDFALETETFMVLPQTLAPGLPPINSESLNVLDLKNILRNAQLRHDLLFDSGVQFRARDKRRLTKRYWEAINREVHNNCTCATFGLDQAPRPTICVCGIAATKSLPDSPTIYTAPIHGLVTIRMPSRIRGLILEFFNIVLRVIQPLSDICSTQPHMIDAQKEEHIDQAAFLRSQVDVDLIYQEISRDIFDPSGLMSIVGETLKTHCAPIRDEAIDDMVAAAASGNKTVFLGAIQSALEILEQMKIDIANHQLKTMRPLLLESAHQFELKVLQSRQRKRSGALDLSITRKWLQSSHASFVKQESNGSQPYPSSLSSYSKTVPLQQLHLCVIKGMVDLTFNPPFAPCRVKAKTAVRSSQYLQPCTPLLGCPETTYLDGYRINSAAHDAADLTALYTYTMLFRTLVSANPKLPHPSNAILSKMKMEIKAIGPRHPGDCYTQRNADREEDGEREASQPGTADVILQIVRRAAEPQGLSAAAAFVATTVRLPDAKTLGLAERWVDTNLRTGSHTDTILRKRLSTAVFNHAVSLILSPQHCQSSPLAQLSSPAFRLASEKPLILDPSAGLEPFRQEIQQLAVKIAGLSLVHLCVYQPVYEHYRSDDSAVATFIHLS